MQEWDFLNSSLYINSGGPNKKRMLRVKIIKQHCMDKIFVLRFGVLEKNTVFLCYNAEMHSQFFLGNKYIDGKKCLA